MQVRAYLVRKYHAKVAAHYQWTEGDVEWSERNTLVYPAICSLAGLVRAAPRSQARPRLLALPCAVQGVPCS